MTSDEKPELRPANESPWYCLATLYGEQSGKQDDDLAKRNRIAWNRWVAGALTEDKRKALIEKGFPAAELRPLSDAETDALRQSFKARIANEALEPPKAGKDVFFNHLRFDNAVDFSGFLFGSHTYFSSTTFSGDAYFSSATFSGDAYFISATFSRVADFGSATFSSDAYFISATFSGYAGFHSATFSGNAHFDSATFSNTANFGSATFSDTADFGSATFSDTADFGSATFLAYAEFRLTTFSGDAEFRSTTFSVYADFGSTTFSSNTDFASATFSAYPDFGNAKFGSRTMFAAASFEGAVPDFRGASLHEAAEWHGARWPRPPQDKKSAQRQVYGYQRLKQEMEKLKKHDDELFFFQKELRAKRGTFRILSPNWCLNALYDVTSSYGQSIVRPFFWLLVLYVSGVIFFSNVDVVEGLPLPWIDAASLSFANLFSFLSLKRDFFSPEMIAEFSRPVLYASAAESILAVALLFLFGLGLRNRFRIK
jgi:hypothetical protein